MKLKIVAISGSLIAFVLVMLIRSALAQVSSYEKLESNFRDENKHEKALARLSEDFTDEATDIIVDFLKNPPNWVLETQRSPISFVRNHLGKRPRHPDLIEALKPYCDTQDWISAEAIINALKDYPNRDSVELLFDFLVHHQSKLRKKAANTLLALSSKIEIPYIEFVPILWNHRPDLEKENILSLKKSAYSNAFTQNLDLWWGKEMEWNIGVLSRFEKDAINYLVDQDDEYAKRLVTFAYRNQTGETGAITHDWMPEIITGKENAYIDDYAMDFLFAENSKERYKHQTSRDYFTQHAVAHLLQRKLVEEQAIIPFLASGGLEILSSIEGTQNSEVLDFLLKQASKEFENPNKYPKERFQRAKLYFDIFGTVKYEPAVDLIISNSSLSSNAAHQALADIGNKQCLDYFWSKWKEELDSRDKGSSIPFSIWQYIEQTNEPFCQEHALDIAALCSVPPTEESPLADYAVERLWESQNEVIEELIIERLSWNKSYKADRFIEKLSEKQSDAATAALIKNTKGPFACDGCRKQALLALLDRFESVDWQKLMDTPYSNGQEFYFAALAYSRNADAVRELESKAKRLKNFEDSCQFWIIAAFRELSHGGIKEAMPLLDQYAHTWNIRTDYEFSKWNNAVHKPKHRTSYFLANNNEGITSPNKVIQNGNLSERLKALSFFLDHPEKADPHVLLEKFPNLNPLERDAIVTILSKQNKNGKIVPLKHDPVSLAHLLRNRTKYSECFFSAYFARNINEQLSARKLGNFVSPDKRAEIIFSSYFEKIENDPYAFYPEDIVQTIKEHASRVPIRLHGTLIKWMKNPSFQFYNSTRSNKTTWDFEWALNGLDEQLRNTLIRIQNEVQHSDKSTKADTLIALNPKAWHQPLWAEALIPLLSKNNQTIGALDKLWGYRNALLLPAGEGVRITLRDGVDPWDALDALSFYSQGPNAKSPTKDLPRIDTLEDILTAISDPSFDPSIGSLRKVEFTSESTISGKTENSQASIFTENQLYRNGELSEAADGYTNCLKKHPRSWDALNNLALTYFHLEREKAAYLLLKYGIAHTENAHLGMLCNQFAVQKKLQLNEEAKDIADHLISAFPSSPHANYTAALVAYEDSEYQTCIDYLKTAQKKAPLLYRAHYLRALAETQIQGKLDPVLEKAAF